MSTLIPPANAVNVTLYWTWMGEDGICRTKIKPGSHVTLKEAQENTDAVSSFYKDKRYPLLIDARGIGSMDREARNQFSTNNRETRINSFAVVVRSPLSRVIGNFFMGLNKPQVPAKLFDNEEEALIWLQTFL